MKRTLLLIIAACSFLSAQASVLTEERLPVVESAYLDSVLKEQFFVQSTMTEREYLIASFLTTNMKKFHTIDMLRIKESLNNLTDQELLILNGTDFKDPTISLILSVLVGGLGVDRFYIGDVGLGVAKLITGGGLGVWWLVDLFLISKKTKDNNGEDFAETMMISQVPVQ